MASIRPFVDESGPPGCLTRAGPSGAGDGEGDPAISRRPSAARHGRLPSGRAARSGDAGPIRRRPRHPSSPMIPPRRGRGRTPARPWARESRGWPGDATGRRGWSVDRRVTAPPTSRGGDEVARRWRTPRERTPGRGTTCLPDVRGRHRRGLPVSRWPARARPEAHRPATRRAVGRRRIEPLGYR